ncbi:MAG: thiamine pyrophosphate-dependent dehydrogenase E1 component subunit alpha [Gammaproteobacteria bacterium TMED225]|jgi:pyruvate dehydrogenase E1 component alpha subunit|nr:MAG: thiamine pyrophosphate-dependent dehydrogenase E1 component subunit alpha [Gammaproteobacteria bacterium TMED225]|tara:strand:+ start:952 stop:1929 length:978 start_codon:yes stop_codon:yes gene_type:complete
MIEKEKINWIYKKIFTIRFFEERIKKIAKEKTVPGYLHTCIGSEAICVGVMAALNQDDWISSTYRNHGHAIAKGCELNEITSEIYGRKTGICKGRGGSMHISDFSKGMLGSFGIVAAGPAVVLGAALQEKINKSNKTCVSFFGDGAIHNGAFHEAAGLAKLWDIPMIFVCENNGYAEATATDWHLNTKELSDITKAYDMLSYIGDGNNVFEVYDITKKAINEAKQKNTPIFLEFKNYRFSGQYEGDTQLYQPQEEIDKAKQNDPIKLAKENSSKYGLNKNDLEKIINEAKEEVDKAFDFADTQPWPQPEDALEEVYVNYPVEINR